VRLVWSGGYEFGLMIDCERFVEWRVKVLLAVSIKLLHGTQWLSMVVSTAVALPRR
jgi:hypothetical protein